MEAIAARSSGVQRGRRARREREKARTVYTRFADKVGGEYGGERARESDRNRDPDEMGRRVGHRGRVESQGRPDTWKRGSKKREASSGMQAAPTRR